MAALLSSACTLPTSSMLLTNKLQHSVDATSKSTSFSPCAGLPTLKVCLVVCSHEHKSKENKVLPDLATVMIAASTVAASLPAVALVDERLSGEGTGLSLGVSSPIFVWIILGVFALIWSLYFTFSSTLPEGDDNSGLSL